MALIIPFIQSLGYDVYNPVEVIPEYISDIGIKKGEKIDYAIMKDGHVTILIECKHWAQNPWFYMMDNFFDIFTFRVPNSVF